MQTEALTLKVVKSHALGGGRDAAVGDVLRVPEDISPAEAVTKLGLGYVEEIHEAPTAGAVEPADATRAPETAPGAVEDQDPAVEDRDPDAEDQDPDAEDQDPDVADQDPDVVDPDPKPATKSSRRKPRPRK